jgi:oxygen-independent coproporphyrinogen-3 oxidase
MTKRARLAAGFARLAQEGYTARSAYTAVRDPARHHFVYQGELYRGADLIGLGVSSFSYLSGVHFQNLARIDPYLERVEHNELPLARAHALSAEERLVRELVLQLKLLRVDLSALRAKFGVDPLVVFERPLRDNVEAGWLRLEGNELAVTPAGAGVVDQVLTTFYLPRHRQDARAVALDARH